MSNADNENTNAGKMLFKNVEKRREITQSEVPVINLDVETAANVSIAIRGGELDPYVFPYYGADGATFVENGFDGGSLLGWLNAEGEAVLTVRFPTREVALYFADGFETAAIEVADSPDEAAVAKIRTEIATFFVTGVIPIDDPRRATDEEMQTFINKLPSNSYYHRASEK